MEYEVGGREERRNFVRASWSSMALSRRPSRRVNTEPPAQAMERLTTLGPDIQQHHVHGSRRLRTTSSPRPAPHTALTRGQLVLGAPGATRGGPTAVAIIQRTRNSTKHTLASAPLLRPPKGIMN